jgi:hypothetical protein
MARQQRYITPYAAAVPVKMTTSIGKVQRKGPIRTGTSFVGEEPTSPLQLDGRQASEGTIGYFFLTIPLPPIHEGKGRR